MFAIALALLACAPLLGLSSQSAPVGTSASAAAVDVHSYHLEVDFSAGLDSVEIVAVVDLLWRRTLRQLRLDFASPREEGAKDAPAGLSVTSVEISVDGEWIATRFEHSSDVLTIDLGAEQAAGGSGRVRVVAAGVPRDGLLLGRNDAGEPVAFADNWPNRARHWIPSVDHPSDKALFTFDVEVPDAYRSVAVGELIEERPLPAARWRTRWRTRAPLATKVATLGVARFQVRREPSGEVPVAISSWVYSGDERALSALAVAPRVLAEMVEMLGPFPYAKLANVQSTTRYGGMENAGAIFYRESALHGDPERVERLVAHEIAHQWFGDAVSEAEWNDVWLSEGFATYLTALFVERTRGVEAFREVMRSARDRVVAAAHEHPSATVRPAAVGEDLAGLLGAHTYQKGAWILHMLRERIGDVAFSEALRGYLEVHRHGNATTADFFAAVRWARERTDLLTDGGRGIESEMRSWLETPGLPRLEGGWRPTPGGVQLVIEQTQDGALRQLPLEVAVIVSRPEVEDAPFAAGEANRLTVPARRRSEMVVGAPAGGGVGVRLDPRVRLLFEQGSWQRLP